MSAKPEPVYSNTIPRSSSKPAKKKTDKDVISKVVFSVLLLLSLLGNGILAHLNFRNDTDWAMSCEPVPNCSHLHVDHNAQNKQIFYKDMENMSAARHCPKQNFPEKWIKSETGFYIFTTEKQDWNSSRHRCQDLGGDLAIINNENEQDIIARHVSMINWQPLYWIGLTDSQTEGIWLWVDGTGLNTRLWDVPPDDHKGDNPLGEDCVVLKTNSMSRWGDVSCLRKESSICEIPCF